VSTVLVTGGSGFVGSHVVLALLNTGHSVRTTVRSMKKDESVRAMLRSAGADVGRLTICNADLTGDSGWPEAVVGCDCVIHVASPLSDSARQPEAEVVAAARDGTLRVLRAALDAKVKRVVMTSSCAAVYYGYPPRAEPFDETNWALQALGHRLTFFAVPKSGWTVAATIERRGEWHGMADLRLHGESAGY